ncbi:MAG TPA: malto-oligosyltrehalose synthase, partial [Nitrolancea sp.]|nr:malto-oligosyltrehalose synthase [Nitrolancea sp.]
MNAESGPPAHLPRATYRLQLTPDFGFDAARRLIPYLRKLGISDIYCSPILTARPGSRHGYDVIDPLHINPELGGDAQFERLAHDARQHGMHLLIDIVPNHMAASIDNPWWYDVLEHGRSSRYAHFFDIEWEPPDPNESLHNRVLLPILGTPYGETLENGEIQIAATDNGYELCYYEHRLPVALEAYALILESGADPLGSHNGTTSDAWETVQHVLDVVESLPPRDRFDAIIADQRQELRRRLGEALAQLRSDPTADQALERSLAAINGIPGEARSFDRLDRIVRRQAYRLAFWQIAREQINYRRFFDVNDLVSLRVIDDDVFETTHERILSLARSAMVSGVRVDHIDGLRDPEHYLQTLRTRLDQTRQDNQESLYLVTEKILASDETLPADWPVSGTTGYDLLNLIGDLFVDAEQLPALEAVYRSVSGVTDSFYETVYRSKQELLETTFAAYVRSLTFNLEGVSNSDRHGQDLTFDSLQHALMEVTAALPVYRTYVNKLAVSDRDRTWIEQAINAARSHRPDLRHTLDFLTRVLLLNIPGYVAPWRHPDWLDVVMRWQQLSGPVMAKGNEDTALYRFFPLSSRNEVGSHLDHPPIALSEVHARLRAIAQEWPHTMIASTTHDTKRSEDVRARIAALSEMPDAWDERLVHWQQLNT